VTTGTGALARLAWYGHRLMAMGPAEMVHRVGEQVARMRFRRTAPPQPGPGPLPRLAGWAEAARALDPAPASWSEARDALAAGQFAWFGTTWPARATGAPPDWHLDPVTGRRWPADSFCFDVPFRHGGGFGDVKLVWEPARLQYLQGPAALAARGDSDAAALVRRDLLAFLADNPPWHGVHWTSGIEIALRATSMIIVLSLLPEAAWSEPDRTLLRDGLAAHGHWLATFPSLHSSANNHRTAEALGLFLLGRTMPDLADAASWEATGIAALAACADAQILGDGVAAEQSPTYGAFTLECLWLAAAIAKRTGGPAPDAIERALARGGMALRWFLDGSGAAPRIGDDDESRVLCDRPGPEAQVARTLDAIAAHLGRADIAVGAAPRGLAALPAGPPPTPAPAPTGLGSFVEGGYWVARETVAGHGTVLVLDHGPLGFLAIAAHGHADTLALWLAVDGRQVLVDAGTYAYHAEPGSRDVFRATAVHNTLAIGADASSVPAGDFNWRHKATGWLERRDGDLGHWTVVASHDGWRRRHRCDHRRTVTRDADGWTVVDALPGRRRTLPVTIGFLVAPDLEVREIPRGAVIALGHGARLTITHDGPLTPELATAEVSTRFGHREATRRVQFSGRLARDQEVAIRIAFAPC
jgi:hypothetical protein